MRFPVFIINMKNYREGSGENVRKFLEYASIVEKETNKKVYIAPPIIDLFHYSKDFSSFLISQYVDVIDYGSYTGHIPMKRLIDININASLLNHSEYKIPHDKIKELVNAAKEIGFDIVVCVDSVDELSKLLHEEVYPSAYAIEPPELIGSGKSVSKYKPETIVEAVKLGEKYNVPILCGAGIVDGEDVKKAFELGVKGVLVASGVVKSKDPLKVMMDMASNMFE